MNWTRRTGDDVSARVWMSWDLEPQQGVRTTTKDDDVPVSKLAGRLAGLSLAARLQPAAIFSRCSLGSTYSTCDQIRK